MKTTFKDYRKVMIKLGILEKRRRKCIVEF